MAGGFLYLVAIMDWYSRYVLSWRLSNTLEVDFCIEALEEALRNGQPEIFNTDQGAQFTSQAFTSLLEQHGIKVSMDGKGRYTDNLFIERLGRSLKYEEVYLKAYAGGKEARAGIGGYFDFYNMERPHQALGYQTPAEVFINGKKTAGPIDLVESRKSSPLAEPAEPAGPALNSAFLLSN
jgi:putative transposase